MPGWAFYFFRWFIFIAKKGAGMSNNKKLGAEIKQI